MSKTIKMYRVGYIIEWQGRRTFFKHITAGRVRKIILKNGYPTINIAGISTVYQHPASKKFIEVPERRWLFNAFIKRTTKEVLECRRGA